MKYFFYALMFIIALIILRINFKLLEENHTKAEQKNDIILQLNFLEQELKHEELGRRMQEVFPEGYIFVNAIYGLAWCELALADPQDKILNEKARQEAVYAYENLKTEEATQFFQISLSPENGIFYSGWRNYLLSKILSLNSKFPGRPAYIQEFELQSENIVKALRAAESPYLESYQDQAWPADMSVAMASISNHDKIFPAKYTVDLRKWTKGVKANLDPATKLVPHMVDPHSGKILEGARGSSMGLILRMLAEIDTNFARQLFINFQPLFVSETFGLPSIREYPQGTSGSGDIDSGPVILEVGFVATIIQLGTFSMYGNETLGTQLYKTIHAFGFDNKNKNEKFYLLGKLPMADAFIAWGRATDLHYSKESARSKLSFWRLKFQVMSILILLIPWLIFFRKKIFKRVKISSPPVFH